MNQNRNRIKISENFYLSEFQSPDTGEVMLHPELVLKLQLLRHQLSAPIIISSGYRTPEHNLAVAGARGSRHMRGLASDIYTPGGWSPLLYQLALHLKFKKVIPYESRGFIHVEVEE